jgi:D-xylose transport system permease protein
MSATDTPRADDATGEMVTPPIEATSPTAEAPPEQSLREAVRDYRARIAAGDIGPLSSALGFLFLVILFTALEPGIFNTPLNFANLLNQSAAVIFISMGLVFVLLLGEIDLSAGFAAGTAAAVLATVLADGQPWYVAVVACLVTGVVIGSIIGVLVAYVRIPSFVITLAFFLALQGVMLIIIGTGGTIRVADPTIRALMNRNLPPLWGWVFAALVVLGYIAVGLMGRRRRAAAGLPLGSRAIFWGTAVVLAIVFGLAVYILNLERSVNPGATSIQGVPIIVPVATVFVVGLGFVLTRTTFGRHIFAVGGNAEAARRAGINVARIRVTCFMITSTMAAVAGIILASRDGSVSPTTGGAQTLLFAVGAAVIGGTSLFGGRGSIMSAVLGGLVIAVIANGLPLVTSEAGIQFVVTGLVLALAATVDALSRRRATAT